jgi:AraC-like DNA-binding protein
MSRTPRTTAHPGLLAEPAATITATNTVQEPDSYSRSVRGIEVRAVRTGKGHSTTSISSEVGGAYVATSIRSGFPLLTRTTIADNLVCAVVIRFAPPGARWCGVDLQTGMVIVYGAEAEHTAINPEGSDFAFTVVDKNDLKRVASEMHSGTSQPPAGQVHFLAPTVSSRAFGSMLASHVEVAMQHGPSDAGGADILASLTAAIASQDPQRRVGEHPYIDNRAVTHKCIEYVEATGRVPTIPELCLVTHVSERRLRGAFIAAYGQPPSRYFRAWRLQAARSRFLQAHGSGDATVTRVAFELGFNHLGRFARYYLEQFGESPSTTLKRSLICADGRVLEPAITGHSVS